MSLVKITVGISGIILALILSIVASGQDFEGEHTIILTGNVRGRVAEVVELPLEGRVYRDVDLIISNMGGKRAVITIGRSSLSLEPGGSRHVEVYDLTGLIKVEFEDGEGELQVLVKAAWKEKVNPMLSLAAILVLIPSMVIAGYGLIEYVVLRRL